MRRALPLVLTLGAAVGLGAGLLARGAGAGPNDPVGPRIAVVDVFACLNAAPRKSELEAANRERIAALDTFVQDQRNKIRDLGGEIERLPQADPRKKKLAEDFNRAKAMLEFDTKWRASQADQAEADERESLYAEVRAVIREVAQQQGYALVLFRSDDPLNLTRSADFSASVAMRSVLHADKAIDITETVKAKLAASKPPAPPSTPLKVPPAPAGTTPPPSPATAPPTPVAPATGPGMGN